jgi:hypothetical protein
MFSRKSISAALLAGAVVASVATEEPYISEDHDWDSTSIAVNGFGTHTQNLNVRADSEAFAFDSSYGSEVKVELDITTSGVEDVPIQLRLYRDSILVSEMQVTIAAQDKNGTEELLDGVALEDCDYGYACSFNYEVEIYNGATDDIDVDMVAYASLTNLDGVTKEPYLESSFY